MDIQELKTIFNGRVIAPADEDYNKARTTFYGGIDKKPAFIVRAADSDDVKNAIELAKSTGLEIAVRSGGHSFAGYCVSDGGMVIDLHDMRKFEFDLKEKTVWAEAGLTARELAEAADKYNLVIGFGDTGSVGIGGITLGGGVGFLTRKFGLTIDNLLAAEIVTADGQVLIADSRNHQDLFWALRGGGGNFGVVTRFKYRLHELGQVLGGLILLPATPEVITNFVSIAENAPDELSAIINIMPAPPMPFVPAEVHGKMSIMALVMYAGDPNEGQAVISKIRALAAPYADMIRPMRYKDIFFPEDETYHPKAVARTMFIKKVDSSLAETIITYLDSIDAPMRAVQLRVLGGAASRVPASATAFAHRSSPIMANIASFYESNDEKKQRQQWVNTLSREIYQDDNGAYVGFLGPDDEDRITDAYPDETMKRLIEVKNRYDPSNLFKLCINIKPNN